MLTRSVNNVQIPPTTQSTTDTADSKLKYYFGYKYSEYGVLLFCLIFTIPNKIFLLMVLETAAESVWKLWQSHHHVCWTCVKGRAHTCFVGASDVHTSMKCIGAPPSTKVQQFDRGDVIFRNGKSATFVSFKLSNMVKEAGMLLW